MSATSNHSLAFGKEVKTAFYIYIVILLLGAGIQSILCVYSLAVFKKKSARRRSRTRTSLLAISFIIWILYTVAAVTRTWGMFVQIQHAGKAPKTPLSFWLLGVGSVLTLVYVLVGDCLMLWRCSVVWNTRKWVLIIPLALLLTSLCFGILSFTPHFKRISEDNPSAQPASVLWAALSASSNVIITGLLVTKLAVARRQELEAQPDGGQSGTIIARLHRDVIVILVESAAPLALAGLCLVIGSVTLLSRRPGETESSMLGLAVFMLMAQAFFLFFGALSPQMILFRTLVSIPQGLVDKAAGGGKAGHRESPHLTTVHITTEELQGI